MRMEMGMGMMMGMGLILLIVLGLAAYGVVALIRRDTRSAPIAQHDSPEERLRRRYADGELDEDEYERRRAGLRG